MVLKGSLLLLLRDEEMEIKFYTSRSQHLVPEL